MLKGTHILTAYFSTPQGLKKQVVRTVETGDNYKALGYIEEHRYEDGPDHPVAESGWHYMPVLDYNEFQILEGKIKTLCEALFVNEKQRDAAKDVMANTLWDWFERTKSPLREAKDGVAMVGNDQYVAEGQHSLNRPIQ